ncbi:MAG TPA: MFS transporter [Sphaerochaeta sp.]|nr:MFS transporter [Sphaerochaeta sp.]
MQDHSATIVAKKPSFISSLPFYYGWVILVVGAIGVLASIPGQTMGVSVFTDHYIRDLSLTRVGVSGSYMVGTLASSLIIPFSGIFYDRRGARLTAGISTFFLGLFLILLACSQRIVGTLSATFSLPLPVVTMGVLTLGFFGIRFFGQGVLTLVSRGMVARWFSSRRGLAVGLMGLVTAFGFSYAPQPLQKLIDSLGWKGALVALASLLLVVFLPLFLLTFRSDPASVSMEMEQGMVARKQKKGISIGDALHQKDVGEARKEGRFWLILLIMGFSSLFTTAFTFHVVSIFSEFGQTAQEAVSIFLPISVISVIARFGGSYLSDRFPIKGLFVAFGISLFLTSLSLVFFSIPLVRLFFLIPYGMASGLFGMLNIVTWPKLYGRKHIGAISGFAMSIVVAGSAIGPWFFSLIYQLFGSYKNAGIAGALFTLALTITLVFTKFRHVETD